ncbi:uncharacterized protein LOC103132674, partial [Poecilia formosa]|uniref:uncharacterized protein LOC103132674 n=1 Tax=Poecilia formosa TaxID=48698 RepID=UPI0007B8E32E
MVELKKRKTESSDDDDDVVKTGFEKNNVVSDSDSSDDETQADDPGSPQSEKITRKNLENQWRSNLSSILDELSEEEYEKLLVLHLDKIPGGMKDKKHRGKMPQIIIQCYGLDMSIKVISKAMDKIPRKDHKIQDLIQPMLQKLEVLTQQDTNNKMRSTGAAGGEKVQSPGRPSKRKRQPSPQPKVDSGASMKAKQKDSSLTGSSAALQKKSTLDLRKTIRDLKASGDLGQKVLTVKVLQKSNLCQYQIKANETKFRFYLGVADETDAIKIQVYGKERFPAIEEGHFYIIRDPLLDHQNVLKISEKTRMSEIRPFRVPRNVELEAEKLIFSPVCSIRDIQSFGDKTPVSVEGTVKEIGVIKSIKMKAKRMKKDKQNFELEDGTGSITVDLWGEHTKHLRGISNGDVVLVNNLKTNLYNDNVSLNSTDSTRIIKVRMKQTFQIF